MHEGIDDIDTLTGHDTTGTHRIPTVAEALPALRQIVQTKSHADVPGGLLVDLLTASAVVGVYDQVSERHQKRMAAMDLLTGQAFAFKVHEIARARRANDGH